MDVFTGKIYEAVIRSSLSVDALDVISKEYQLIDIEWDGSTVLLLEDGSLREDFKISVTDDTMGGVSVILLTSFLRFIFSGIDGEKLKRTFWLWEGCTSPYHHPDGDRADCQLPTRPELLTQLIN